MLPGHFLEKIMTKWEKWIVLAICLIGIASTALFWFVVSHFVIRYW